MESRSDNAVGKTAEDGPTYLSQVLIIPLKDVDNIRTKGTRT